MPEIGHPAIVELYYWSRGWPMRDKCLHVLKIAEWSPNPTPFEIFQATLKQGDIKSYPASNTTMINVLFSTSIVLVVAILFELLFVRRKKAALNEEVPNTDTK